MIAIEETYICHCYADYGRGIFATAPVGAYPMRSVGCPRPAIEDWGLSRPQDEDATPARAKRVLLARSTQDGHNSFLPAYLETMFSYQPSYVHYALAELETEGKMTGIITTNVDCMHTIAGSKNVAEIQGSLQVNCCSSCGRHYDGYEIWKQEKLPMCESCGGEILPWPLYSHISVWNPDARKAKEWIAKADMILVIGTHGNYGDVYWDYRKRDAVIVQINPGHTYFDSIADLNIRQGSDEVFHKLMETRDKEV